MPTHIVYAHPKSKQSNCATILNFIIEFFKSKGEAFTLSDLYEMKFNSVLDGEAFECERAGKGGYKIPPDVEEEQNKIKQANNLVFIFPVWWSSAPAILKGYIDRVFTVGFAYGIENGEFVPLLKGKKALVVNTFGGEKGPESTLPKKLFDQAVLAFCGLEVTRKALYGTMGESPPDISKFCKKLKPVLTHFVKLKELTLQKA